MVQPVKIAVLFLALISLVSAQPTNRLYRNYVTAFKNEGTFQYFLVVKIKNLNTGITREYCTKGAFLNGALHREYNLGYDSKSETKVNQLVINNQNRYFEFKNDSAIYNISACKYTMNDLAKLEKKIDFDSLTTKIKRDKKWSKRLSDSMMHLYAHALFNRGILTGESSCYGGELEYVK